MITPGDGPGSDSNVKDAFANQVDAKGPKNEANSRGCFARCKSGQIADSKKAQAE